jgi:hypothetical protein
MVDLSWGPFDCAFERVGPPSAKAGGQRSTTSFGLISLVVSTSSKCDDSLDLELDVEPGRSLTGTEALPDFFATWRLTLPDSRRASAPATDAAGVDRRVTGAALARRSTGVFFFVCSDMMASAGAAPAASSHLVQRGLSGFGWLAWRGLPVVRWQARRP